MSLSPAASSSSEHHTKRRRTESDAARSGLIPQSPVHGEHSGHQADHANGSASVPKRGARACTNCRKGKNRCEGEAPCRRCQLSGLQCVFEKPAAKPAGATAMSAPGMERLSRLEGQYLVMQSQMIGMQSSLDRILSAVQTQTHIQQQALQAGGGGVPVPVPVSSNSPYSTHHTGPGGEEGSSRPRFPPLPGFAPPPHKYGTYGIVPSTAPSSDDESDDTLPRSALSAPIEALQGLANAAAEAAAVPSNASPRVRKRKKAEPIPRNAFPHVVEKGLVSDAEARDLFHIFFSGCHLFIPLFDPTTDTYEALSERSPWTLDAILAVASKIRSGTGPLSPTFYRCLEEAQGIARSSLFGPVVRKEAVMGMLLLAAWSTNGWLPSGHAMRMALDLGLQRALEKLVDSEHAKRRSEEEERDLVVSARIWLCLYWFDHQMSLGTGRPIVLRDESTIKHCRILLTHHMASMTDVRLVSQVELIAQKTQIYETLAPLHGDMSHTTSSFIRRANAALDAWWTEHDSLHHARGLDEDSLLRVMLRGELHYAKLWLVCVALRGARWEAMPFEQRELAFQAKDAASACLSVFLESHAYRAAIRYAVHDSLVTAAFSGLFLLKMANLFPAELDLPVIIGQVEQLAQVLSDVSAERYALTLRVMLASLRRKLNIGSMPAQPSGFPQNGSLQSLLSTEGMFIDLPLGRTPGPGGGQQGQQQQLAPFTMEELGFGAGALPPTALAFGPGNIPAWLQEHSLNDLGIPMNGSEGIFLQMAGHNNGWAGDFAPMPEAW